MRIVLTPGEPAGIGPDIVVQLAQQAHNMQLVAVADRLLLEQRAKQLGLPLLLHDYCADDSSSSDRSAGTPAGELWVCHESLPSACRPGQLNTNHAQYVLNTLQRATQGCMSGEFAALVTGPVQKSVMNQAGITFSGHTEWLAAKTQSPQVVMLLASDHIRVALVTTHMPLSQVPASISYQHLQTMIRIIDHDFQRWFDIAQPRIGVLGLNPHAGENGHLGTEEIDIIIPCLESLRREGLQLIGPLSADTAFTPQQLAGVDVILAMYHDQGLPVLKSHGFGAAVNITLGLPFVRTSVDHGTALLLAGTGKADHSSLVQALQCAVKMAERSNNHPTVTGESISRRV